MYCNIVFVTGMQKGDEASPNIILPGRVLLVKMLITLVAHCILLKKQFCITLFLPHLKVTFLSKYAKAIFLILILPQRVRLSVLNNNKFV